MTVQVFAVPVFVVVFRETLETVIIVSVLLAFLKQTLNGPERDAKVYKKLIRQVRQLVLNVTAQTQLLILARYSGMARHRSRLFDMSHRRRGGDRYLLHPWRQQMGRRRAGV
jgi:high-affinity Fe2+/Pb2+ permease